MQGNVPSTQKAMDLYQILNESDTNLRQPVGLEKQLLKHMTLDSEVGQSMLQLLQVIHKVGCTGVWRKSAESANCHYVCIAFASTSDVLHTLVPFFYELHSVVV